MPPKAAPPTKPPQKVSAGKKSLPPNSNPANKVPPEVQESFKPPVKNGGSSKPSVALPKPPPHQEPPPLEVEAETKDEKNKASEVESEKRNSDRFGDLLPHVGSDHWDEDLIPEWLCCQVHNEMITPPSSSEESYDSIDAKGKVVRKRRKKIKAKNVEEEEEEEEEHEESMGGRERTESLRDVYLDGWLEKEKLREMSLQQIQLALTQINEEIDILRVENLVFDRTVKKMEKRELEIEAALPPFTYKFPWEMEMPAEGEEVVKVLHPDAVCGDLSDDEPDPPDGIYKPYIPAEDPEIDHDALAAMLQVGDDGGDGERQSISVTNFLASFGEIPPSNFDVIRHKYGDLVKHAKYAEEEDHNSKEHGRHHRHRPERDPFASETQQENVEDPGYDSGSDIVNWGSEEGDSATDLSMIMIPVADFEEDPEFPGFNPHDAKKLPIGEKIKYAHIEEESIREEFIVTETEGTQQENAIQVYIDTYTDSNDLSVKMMEIFHTVVAEGIHHLTGKMRAEKIMQFRDKLKKRFLEEEAKVKIRLTENMKKRRKVDKQLKMAADIGGTIQRIDYENLRVQNFEFQSSIEDRQADLKKLKFITTEWFQKLERNRDRLNRLLTKQKNLETDITIRGNLKASMQASVDQSLKNVEDIDKHCAYLKKRLLAFSAPSTLDYIKQKSKEHQLEEEADLLRTKVGIINKQIGNARMAFERLLQMVPDKSAMRQTTETWLEEIKAEVEEKDLMQLYDDEEAGSLTQFVNYKKHKASPDSQPIRRSPVYDDPGRQSSIFLQSMTQSVMELYKVGKERQRDSIRRRLESIKPQK